MSDIKALLEKKAKRPERTMHVCVAADLVDKHQTLNAELAELLAEERRSGKGGSRRLNDASESRKKADEITALEAEMADASVEIRLRAVPAFEWREWRNNNQAREGVELDERLGVNSDELIGDMVRRCIVDPEFDDDDWATWTREVAAAEQLSLAILVFSMHEQRVDVPKSPLASLVTAGSDGDSKRQNASE